MFKVFINIDRFNFNCDKFVLIKTKGYELFHISLYNLQLNIVGLTMYRTRKYNLTESRNKHRMFYPWNYKEKHCPLLFFNFTRFNL